tara:strand:- start:1248 stop:1544 length:297 start_codon:yes stop_codon:yes gene_type:complete
MASNNKMVEHIVSTHKNAKRVMRKHPYKDNLLAVSYDIEKALSYLGKLTVAEAASSKWLDMWKGRIWKYEFKVNDLLASIVGWDGYADLEKAADNELI